jgi:uncharacterized protein (TIGR00369 family)
MNAELVVVNSDYVARVSASLAAQAFMHKLLGARVTRVEAGLVEIEASLGADLLQPHGNAHGMVLSALADSATGYAAQTLLAAEFDVVTVEFKVNYLTPAFGPRIRAVGRVMRAGRTLHVCGGDVYSCGDGPDKLVAHMVATMMVVAA